MNSVILQAVAALAAGSHADEVVPPHIVRGADGSCYEVRKVTYYKVDVQSQFKAGGNISPTPAISSDHLFSTSFDGNIYELTASLQLVRKYTVGGQIVASPLVMPGHEIVGINTAGLGRVFFPDGSESDPFNVDGSLVAAPLLVDGHAFLTANQKGDLNYFRLVGKRVVLIKHFGVNESIDSTPAFLPDGTLVVTTEAGHIFGLDPDTGAVRWSYMAGSAITGSPIIAPDPTRPGHMDVIAGSHDGYVYIRHDNHAVDKIWAGGPIISAPLAFDSDKIAVGAGKRMVLMNRQKVLASYETHGDVQAPPNLIKSSDARLPDLLVSPSMDGGVYFFNAQTGEIRGVLATDNAFRAGAAVQGNLAYIGDNNLHLKSYSLTNTVDTQKDVYVKF